MRRALLCEGKERANLHAIGAQSLYGIDSLSRSDAAGCQQRQLGDPAYGWNQAECGRLLASVVSAGLKALGNQRIHARLLSLTCKLGRRDHMSHLDAMLVQPSCPLLGRAGRSKDNLHPFLHKNLHYLLHLRIHQRQIYAKGVRGRFLCLADVLAQRFRVH